MKRLTVFMVIAALLVGVGLVSSYQYVSAQQPVPGDIGDGYGYGYGRGMMNGAGGWMMNGGVAGQGVMHTDMQEALAAKLGITVEEYQQAYTDGKTFWQIAEEKGISLEDAQQMMIDARNEALDKAVAAGSITQEQADWMKQRMTNITPGSCHGGVNGANSTGFGRGRGGMMGRWNQ